MSGEKEPQDEEESFLDLYLRYTEKQESPAMFHLWVAITVLAAALGRKCYIDRGYYKLFPNLFTILVAGSARCRKSTAIGIGVRLLDGIDTTKVLAGKITPEKFLQEIADSTVIEKAEGEALPIYKTPSILVHSSELSVLLTKQSYGEPLIYLLTDLFDCPDRWEYKLMKRPTVLLRDVFICILAATTPDGVAKGIPESALHEGFASRILFVYQGDTDRRNAFPELSAEELEMYTRLRDMLRQRAQLEGTFTLTDPAKAWFRTWYDGHMKANAPDRRLEGVYGRKHDHLLRLAMVFAGSYNRKVIDLEHLEAALMTLNTLEQYSSGAFAQIGGDQLTPHEDRAIAFIKHYKTLSYSLWLKYMQPLRAPEFKIILETLLQRGFVRRDENKPNLFHLVVPD